MTADGVCATFQDPSNALGAALQLQQAILDPAATAGIAMRVRCGLHVGAAQPRDGDFYGATVNRAARIMSAAHGGQVLLSQAMFELVRDRLPAGASLRDLGNVRLRNLARPERLFQLEHPADEFRLRQFPDATPNNLPEQLTSVVVATTSTPWRASTLRLTFVGRAACDGGLLQVAAGLLDRYQDGVWLVELAAITDPALVVQAVMQALTIREEPGKSLLQTLIAHVQGHALLLVVG